MAPHYSTLAWKIPWMEEPGRLQSMGSLRVRLTERLHFHFSLSCFGEGNGNPLQYSWLENPRDGGAWWAAVYESRTRLKRLSSSRSFMKSTMICDKEVFLSQMHSKAWWSMFSFYLWRLTRPYMDNLDNLNSFSTLTEWCFLVFMKTEDRWITKLVLFLTCLKLISSSSLHSPGFLVCSWICDQSCWEKYHLWYFQGFAGQKWGRIYGMCT